MNQNIPMFTAMAAGAAAMFLLDPTQGRRRRALARDKAVRWSKDTARVVGASARDTRNRLQGMRARIRRPLEPGEVPDETLVARIRSAIGRVVTHPGAVHVVVEDSIVSLDGAVLANEVDALSAAVRGVDGVIAIDNRLRVCQQAGDVPSLQGSGTPPRSHWRHLARTPMARLCAGLSGAAIAFGVTRAAIGRHRSEPAGPNLGRPNYGASERYAAVGGS